MEAAQEPSAWDYEFHEEEMGNLVCIGDNFVVLALKGNNEGVDFYVLQCQFNQPMLSPIILHVSGVMSFRLEIW